MSTDHLKTQKRPETKGRGSMRGGKMEHSGKEFREEARKARMTERR